MKIGIVLSEKVKAELLDLSADLDQKPDQWIYNQVLDTVKPQLRIYNTIMKTGELQLGNTKIKEDDLVPLNIDELPNENGNVQVLFGPKMTERLKGISSLTNAINKRNNTKVWDTVNSWLAAVVEERVIEESSKSDEKDLREEKMDIEKENKKIDKKE